MYRPQPFFQTQLQYLKMLGGKKKPPLQSTQSSMTNRQCYGIILSEKPVFTKTETKNIQISDIAERPSHQQ